MEATQIMDVGAILTQAVVGGGGPEWAIAGTALLALCIYVAAGRR